ncbi:hypothetical protein KKB54_00930 [bacterium]|nr:hypothetical protein [bacterium]MBU0899372.1 hypothetical protein [bacterium]MBU1153241.1 hypothetical protein [bacterium]MBU1782028.1 hypothetical protein [bacterium]
MDLEKSWQKAIRETEIIRHRISPLQTFKTTDIPYILLSPSQINAKDTVIRKGNVLIHEPSIILPKNYPIFEGFDFEESYHADKSMVSTFLLFRGVAFPSLKFYNQTSTLDIFENPLEKAIEFFKEKLEREENVKAGLIVGPSDCWQFSVLIFVSGMVAKSAGQDIVRLIEKLRKENQ